MRSFVSLIALFALLQTTFALPVPVLITRYHTKEGHTTTVYHTDATETITIPVVQVFISGTSTWTHTLTTIATGSSQAATIQPTTTSVISTSSIAAATTSEEPTISVSTSAVVSTSSAVAETTEASTSTFDATTTTSASTQVDTTTSASSSSSFSSSSTLSSSSSSSLSSSAEVTSTSATKTSSSLKSSPSTQSSSTSTDSAISKVIPTALVYSPYNNDGSCKDYDSVQSDLELIVSKGIASVRIYGNDCNYLTTVLPLCSELGLKVNQGFWISSDGVDSIDDAVSDFISAVQSSSYGWDLFTWITVGNEAIISEYCTVDELISKIKSVKSKLQAAGYDGKVTTSEPPVTFENNPSLCTDSDIDFVGINSHAYFDENSSAKTAGTFVKGQISLVKQYCGDLDVIVTETGYPSAGNTNGGNVPSTANQKIAIAGILNEVGSEVTILSTFDDYWKSPGPYGIEQSFGVIHLLA